MKKRVLIPFLFLLLFAKPLFGDDTDLFTARVTPNLLIVFDNSNSMDEDFWGGAAGSYSSNSKSVSAKKTILNIIDQFKTRMRMGLMTYKVYPSYVSANYLHNSPYFASYEPKSWCPNPPPECVTYAKTGVSGDKATCNSACRVDNPLFDADYLDEIIPTYAVGSDQRNNYGSLVFPKTQRRTNSADPSRYVYYKHAYPMYSSSNEGTAFCYSSTYNPHEGTPWDSYSCYSSKTGTSDDNTGYSNLRLSGQFSPTDSDYALGYQDFGRRISWSYTGRTWFSNSSPGNGYLHVAVNNLVDGNGNDTSTYTSLRNKLDPKENNESGYMSCSNSDKNTCSYVVNAGLTPTAGTFKTATDYFKGTGYTSPVQQQCQRNFILYVTDGLPSVNEYGTPGSADSLMPAVLSKIDALRNLSIRVGSRYYNFDIQTYVLGVGLSDEAKPKLDQMAGHGGTADVDGHAYYADDEQQLIDALNKVFEDIIERSYSFTAPSVPSVRLFAREMVYISSFQPSSTAFWPGTMKGYQLNANGTLPVNENGEPLNSAIWEASIPASGDRHIKTYATAGFVDFTSANVTRTELNASTNSQRDQIISFVRGQQLGDVFHSTAAVVGPPSRFFEDDGYNGSGGFYESKKERTKVVIAGANDGMLHAFDANTGSEVWAFIPNAVLMTLKSMMTTHTYYVDSSPKVADVWFYGSDTDTTKSESEWRTVLICGLRKGGKKYFALDITDTTNPTYLWEFPRSNDSTTLGEVGQSWSEPTIGRVKIEFGGQLYERWVAFIGGGYDTDSGGKGKVCYVIDVKTGNIIKRFTLPGMSYAFAAPATLVDTNGDGFIDKAYIGDVGATMWVFDLSFNEATKKSDSLWTGRKLFNAPFGVRHEIYYAAAVALDKNRNPWVYFGVGDIENPTNLSEPQKRFYAVRDDGIGSYPRNEGDLGDVTSTNTFTQDPSKKGWYIMLEKTSGSNGRIEQVFSKASVFNRLLYFTSYTYMSDNDPCTVAGTGKLYIVEFLSGGGALTVTDGSQLTGTGLERSQDIGTGAPSAPVISVDLRGKASVIIGSMSNQIYTNVSFSRPTNREILYWREVVP